VILGFNDYMDALPAKLEKDGIEVIIPYHNSNLLRSSIPDKANRTIALFYLAHLPAKTFDKVEKKVVSGIKGMETFIRQLPTEYEERLTRLKNSSLRDRSNISYNYWLIDRSNHGLLNTVAQYKELDSFLTELYPKWYLIKFIYGDVSATGEVYGGEAEMYAYGLPLAYKAFGIPLSSIGGSPYIFGTMGGEWAVPLPDNVIAVLKQAFPNSRMAIGYGNLIGMYSCIDGLEKDGITEIRSGLRGNSIYLWKK
jgi:hypothetical protein